MFSIKEINKAIEQISAEKDLDPEQVKDAVEAALASAYKKEFDRRGEIIRAHLNTKTGEVAFEQVKTVVDEETVRFPEPEEEMEEGAEEEGASTDVEKAEKKEKTEEKPSSIDVLAQEEVVEDEDLLPLYNEARHILIEDAVKEKKDAVVGDEITYQLPDPSEEFGRIAAQTAKQVILQRLREIEKEMIKGEFEERVGELVSGMVQRIERGNVFVDLGKASGLMFFSEAIPGEHYRIGERLRFYLMGVQESGRTPTLLLSRTHPRFISKLFELEVPEIADGIVEVKGIVREPGQRTKIAVASTVEGVDPVGACVGQRGARVMAVNNELVNEKIDIIEWSEDIAEYIAASLSPAQVSSVEIIPPNGALVLVPEDQLSLAIGKGGQNVRLAARLTGWRIDVRSQTNPEEIQEEGVVAEEATTPQDHDMVEEFSEDNEREQEGVMVDDESEDAENK
jgi:N utilization substance protein A